MSTISSSQRPILTLVLLTALFAMCVFIAFVLATQNVYWAAGLVFAVAFFLIGFLSPLISLYILIFSMLLSPEIGARDISGRGFTVRFEDLLLLVMGFAWLAKSAVHKNIGLAMHTDLNKPIFLYILACTIATALGIMSGHVNPALTGIMFVMKYIEYFVIFFLTVNNTRTKKNIKQLLIALLTTYVIIVIIAFSQIPSGRRITAPFEGAEGEPNTLGGYLIIMLALNITLFLNSKQVRYKVGTAIMAAMGFIAILYTLSRSSWLGFGVTYATLILLSKHRKILMLSMVIGLMVAPLFLPEVVVDRIMYTFRKDQESQALSQYTLRELEHMYHTQEVAYDTSTLARLDNMRQSIEDFQKKPILGYGVTGYMFLDAQFHRVLIETGIVGLLTFCYLLWVTASRVYAIMKKHYDDPLYNTVTVATMAAFAGLLAHSIGTNTFIIVRIMEPFWCLVGLNFAIKLIEEEKEEENITIAA